MKVRKSQALDVEAALVKADPKLGRLISAVIAKAGKQDLSRDPLTPFESLVRAVVYQQMAGRAAAPIFGRVQSLRRAPLEPRDITSASAAALRRAGMSSSKVKCVQRLAGWFEAHEDLAARLHELPNDAIIDALTSIPGIGLWTANVFLIFSLQRPDVVPAADLGIRRAVQLAYGLAEVASPEWVLKRSERWQPYRSLASVYLWTSITLKLTPEDLRATRRKVA
jgi:DNA-3-methyladenine glycosylase II